MPIRRRLTKRHKQRRKQRQRNARLQQLENRHLMTAAPLGATPLDTGEFLLGRVLVTPVFLESNGEIDTQSQDWDEQEISDTLARITEGVNWWSTTLANFGTVHTLEFVIDDTFARDPFETQFEPIDRPSNSYVDYASEFYIAQDLAGSPSLENAAKRFNDDQRDKFDTDWSFTIFVADSSDDPDGSFAAGGQFSNAFAFAGGLFFVMPSTRPASTVSHELGHIFWARDEYPGSGSYTDRRGYYNAQNLNAADNPAGGQQDSILRGGQPLIRAFESFTSPETTLALVGWRDSDGDGIFDLADVPLDLDVTGYFDSENSTFNVSGTASAVPLINQNSSGVQSDITLNRISEVQYRIDGANWQVIAEPDLQVADINVSVPIDGEFETIEFRVLDTASGVSSPIVQGTQANNLITEGGIRGFSFLDENLNDQRDLTEIFLAGTEVIVTHSDGSALFHGAISATDFDEGELPAGLEGLTLTADGPLLEREVRSLGSDELNGTRVFQAFNPPQGRLVDGWNENSVLVAEFDELVGTVSIDAIGLTTPGIDGGSFARLEAYDVNGLLIARTTSELIETGTTETVTVQDPQGRIASVRAFGHATTDIAISSIEFGTSGQVTVADDGSWQLDNLADGQYEVQFATENVIHQIDSITVGVNSGTSELQVAPVSRVDSTRHNIFQAADVNQDSSVSALDALLVINDIQRQGARTLAASEIDGHKIDVTNDGLVSALDALIVINTLNDSVGEGEQVTTGEVATFDDQAAATDFVRNTDAAFAELSPNALEGQWTNDPISASFASTPDSSGQDLAGLLDSAGRVTKNESISTPEADTRSDGVEAAIFSESTSPTKQAQIELKTVNTTEEKTEKSTLKANSATLEYHVESNLLEPNEESRV